MKNSFLTLVKINFKNLFSSMLMVNNSKKKKIGMSILFAFLGVYLLGFGFYMAWTMAKQLPPQALSTILFIGFLLSFVLMLFNTMFSANLYIFKAKDFDNLITLPIKKSVIVLSKFISLLILCYFYSFFAFVPFAIVYFINAFNIWSLIMCLFSFIIFPFFAIFIGFLLSFLINLISKSFKHSNVILIILSLILVAGVIYINSDFQNVFNAFITNNNSMMSVLNSIFFPIFFATRAITSLSFLNLLYFILISVVPLILTIWLITKFFVKLNSLMQTSAKVKKFEYATSQSNSITKALVKKEFKKLFSSPNYFLNSCMTPIIILIIGAVTMFYDVFGLGAIPTQNDLFATLFLLCAMMLLLTNPLTVTYSLEGKSFWQIKTLPLTFKQITSAKYISYLILYLPTAVIGSTFFGIAYGFDFKAIVLLICIVSLAVIFGGLLSLLINLKNNNIHFTNEIVVIKQSMSVLYNMLISLAIVITLYFLYIFLFIKILDFYNYFAIIGVLFVIGTYILYNKLKKEGEKLFNKIE